MRFFDVTSRQATRLENWIAVGVAAVLVFLTSIPMQGQCQPAAPGSSQSGTAQAASAALPQFYDEAQFTVAGVTDTTNLGGHGSDTVVRTKESLAKDTVSLSREAAHDAANSPIAGKSPQVLSDLERAAEQNPGDFEAVHALARAYVTARKYDDARTNIRALLAHPDLRAPQQAELHHLLGDVEERLNNPLDAVREYQRAAELDPSELNLFDWGAELLAHHAPEPALEVFAKGNRLFPRSSRMLIALGVSWHAHGAYERAIQCLCQASDLNPSDPLPYLFLGKIQSAETIQSKDVADRFERFARLHPENALANYTYAVALSKQNNGTPDAASVAQQQALLQKAIRIDPKLGPASLQLGILYAEQHDFDKAISAFQHAIAVSPEFEEPHYRLAQIYRRVGEKAKAQQELQRYEQLSKQAKEKAERERHEIQQFVISLRDPSPGPPPQQKP